MSSLWETVFVFLVLGAVAFWAYKRKFLDNEGLLVAFIVGLSVFVLDGIEGFIVLIVFFGVAELATMFLAGKRNKEKHALRNTSNILGNALAGIVALILNSPLGFFAAISGSLADTLASEIGILSKTKPFLITTLKPVEYGTDGGVSWLGFSAAIVGSAIMAALYFGFTNNVRFSLIVFFAGLFGTIVDSVLGATLQPKGYIDNNEVNFLSSGIAALAAYLVSSGW